MSPEDESQIQFLEMCDRVRIYFEVARAIEGLSEEVYESFIELEDIVLSGKVDADEFEFESIVSTVAEAIISPNVSIDDLEW